MNSLDNLSFIEVVVLDIGYNLIECGIVGIDKKIYVHKFPPALNTTSKPMLASRKENGFHFEHQFNNDLRRDTLLNFWQDNNLYQANGNWKGGEWGSNNLPTSSKNFCSGIFIGDRMIIHSIKNGIIPYNKRFSAPFEEVDNIIEESDEFAWSTNITLINTNITYSCYVCDTPMPQSAIDVLFVWENSLSHKYVKILKRGVSNPNVDMPCLLMPGAGEHKEPGNNVNFKSDALRAISEEIGISQNTISKSYLIKIGIFNGENRDPRYWSYSAFQDGKLITFGPKRYSATELYVLYIHTDDDVEPDEIDCEDKIEVGGKYWIELNNPILKNNELWMIPEHSLYFNHATCAIETFKSLSEEDKNKHRINL